MSSLKYYSSIFFFLLIASIIFFRFLSPTTSDNVTLRSVSLRSHRKKFIERICLLLLDIIDTSEFAQTSERSSFRISKDLRRVAAATFEAAVATGNALKDRFENLSGKGIVFIDSASNYPNFRKMGTETFCEVLHTALSVYRLYTADRRVDYVFPHFFLVATALCPTSRP